MQQVWKEWFHHVPTLNHGVHFWLRRGWPLIPLEQWYYWNLTESVFRLVHVGTQFQSLYHKRQVNFELFPAEFLDGRWMALAEKPPRSWIWWTLVNVVIPPTFLKRPSVSKRISVDFISDNCLLRLVVLKNWVGRVACTTPFFVLHPIYASKLFLGP